jgi:hypothetical protein
MPTSGFDVSSSERYSGQLLLEVTSAQGPAGATELVERRLRCFTDSIRAGFFFPGQMGTSVPVELRVVGASVQGLLVVDDLPVTALAVLGGMLADGRHHDVPIQVARAVMAEAASRQRVSARRLEETPPAGRERTRARRGVCPPKPSTTAADAGDVSHGAKSPEERLSNGSSRTRSPKGHTCTLFEFQSTHQDFLKPRFIFKALK